MSLRSVMPMRSLTLLGTLALGLASLNGNSPTLGQEIIRETPAELYGNGIEVAQRQDRSNDEQVITIVSERVIEPNETSASKSDCECLWPGGKIWEKLLAQELENARLTARIELEEEKFKLHREHMAERIRELETQLEQRSRERMLRDRETEAILQQERRQFEKEREEMERNVRGLEQRLEVAGRKEAETDELRKVLKENQERHERLADENAEMKAKLRYLEEALEVTKQKLVEKMEASRKPEHKDEHAKEKENAKEKNDRKKKE